MPDTLDNASPVIHRTAGSHRRERRFSFDDGDDTVAIDAAATSGSDEEEPIDAEEVFGESGGSAHFPCLKVSSEFMVQI